MFIINKFRTYLFKVTVNVVKLSLLATSILPLCKSMILFTIDKPTPLPSLERDLST